MLCARPSLSTFLFGVCIGEVDLSRLVAPVQYMTATQTWQVQLPEKESLFTVPEPRIVCRLQLAISHRTVYFLPNNPIIRLPDYPQIPDYPISRLPD